MEKIAPKEEPRQAQGRAQAHGLRLLALERPEEPPTNRHHVATCPSRCRGNPRFGHWDVRVTHSNGERTQPEHLPVGTSFAKAQDYAQHLMESAASLVAAGWTTKEPPPKKAAAKPSAAPVETLAQWLERWDALLRERANRRAGGARVGGPRHGRSADPRPPRDRSQERRGEGTKTEKPRHIPIEPALVPLLEAMKRESGGKGRVIRMPALRDLAVRTRQYLRWAGVTRAELFANDKRRKQIGFYDASRGTGITWAAMRNDPYLKIQARAGHASFSTTQGYIKEAENLTTAVGTPFPTLPNSLMDCMKDDEGVSLSVSYEGLPTGPTSENRCGKT